MSTGPYAVKRPYPRTAPCAIECRCDGNQVYALIGKNQMDGACGFGDTLPDALRDLADELEREVGQIPTNGGTCQKSKEFESALSSRRTRN